MRMGFLRTGHMLMCSVDDTGEGFLSSFRQWVMLMFILFMMSLPAFTPIPGEKGIASEPAIPS